MFAEHLRLVPIWECKGNWTIIKGGQHRTMNTCCESLSTKDQTLQPWAPFRGESRPPIGRAKIVAWRFAGSQNQGGRFLALSRSQWIQTCTSVVHGRMFTTCYCFVNNDRKILFLQGKVFPLPIQYPLFAGQLYYLEYPPEGKHDPGLTCILQMWAKPRCSLID